MYSVLIISDGDFIGLSLAKYFVTKKYKVDIMTPSIKPINYYGIRNQLVCDRKIEVNLKEVLKNRKYDYIYDLNYEEINDIKVLSKSLDIKDLKKYILLLSPKNMQNEESQVQTFMENISIPYIIIKSSNIYGCTNRLSKEICIFEKIEKSIPIKIPKNKKLKAQFIYIEDFVKVLYSLTKVKYVREVYNVTNPQFISIEDYIKTFGEVVGKEPIIKYIDDNSIDVNIIENFENNYLDIDKIIKHGVYIPNILLKNGISAIYNWYKGNNHTKTKIKDKLGKVLQIG